VSQKSGNPFVCGLWVGPKSEDNGLLREVFRTAGWRLHEALARKQAIYCLRQRDVHVVLTSHQNQHWPWKRALQELQRMPRPPQLVVTSRLADEALWAEVLNWGGFDVLAEPLRREEVERVIASARRHYEPQPVSGTSMRAAS
jgi:DNA-binding response OmpR family regulator